jgi:hypothetical protein
MAVSESASEKCLMKELAGDESCPGTRSDTIKRYYQGA